MILSLSSLVLLVPVLLVSSVVDEYEQCRPGNHSVLDDLWRDVNNANQSNVRCDVLSSPPAWYRFILKGQSAIIPTTPPSIGRCGTTASMWHDLGGSTPPAFGKSSVGRACAVWGGLVCGLSAPGLVVFNCGNFFVYQLPNLPGCPITYCAQQDFNECSSNPCRNNGTCVDGLSSYKCTCPAGFIGTTCETNINECSSNPCRNNGTCVDGVNSYKCTCRAGFIGTTCETMCALTNPPACAKPFEQETAAYPWTVFQRRCNGCVLFNRTMAEYKAGFGTTGQEIWLGLDRLHNMTSQKTSELRIDIQLGDGTKKFAVYSNFSVGPSTGNYTLNYAQKTSGDLYDLLQSYKGMQFSTDGVCAQLRKGGWWFPQSKSTCSGISVNSPYNNVANCSDILCPMWLGFVSVDKPSDGIRTVELRFRPMNP